jgi:hypothetical protein
LKNYKLEREIKNRADWKKSSKEVKVLLDCSVIEEEEEEMFSITTEQYL